VEALEPLYSSVAAIASAALVGERRSAEESEEKRPFRRRSRGK
jgi:hypothetical protein